MNACGVGGRGEGVVREVDREVNAGRSEVRMVPGIGGRRKERRVAGDEVGHVERRDLHGY